MIHLSLNLPSETAARAAARRAKRLYPFAESLLRGGGGGGLAPDRPPTPPLLKDDSDNSGWGGVESPQPPRTIENVPGGQGSPRCCSSHPFTRHQGDIPEVILGFWLAEPGSNRGRSLW